MRFIAAAFLFTLALPALAQDLNGPVEILDGQGFEISHSSSDAYKYIAYSVQLRGGSIGIIGFQRTVGMGDFDVRVGTSIQAVDHERASVGEVVAENTTDDSAPDLLLFMDDGFSTDRFYVEAWSHDNEPGRWRIRYEEFNVTERVISAVAIAATVRVFECAFVSCDAAAQGAVQENVGRALNLGLSVLTRNSVCAVGSDVIMEEISGELGRELPDQRFVVLALMQLMSDFVADVATVQCPV